jgi:hypothetical protein
LATPPHPLPDPPEGAPPAPPLPRGGLALRPGGAKERQALDQGWYYIPQGEDRDPSAVLAEDGRWLARRAHGHPGRVWLDDPGRRLSRAEAVRLSSALGRVGAPGAVRGVQIGPGGLDPAPLRGLPAHRLEAALAAALPGLPSLPPPEGPLPPRAAPRALFFESLMNSDLPHNDRELSQGVLHMIAGLRGLGVEVVLANVKMHITGQERPVHGLDGLRAALQRPVHLVCITLLEGYFEGVQGLIACLRELGCRAHIAVGGVMPSLAPEHVAAHLDGVSFVCRGAGEVHVPLLCAVVGEGDVDTPFTPGQRAALLAHRGLIAFDPGGGLIAARPDAVPTVDDLDRVDLDLGYLERRHVEAGIEITTSRGCIHRCTFCSILGRESYQARSAGNVFELLAAYEARFEQIFAPGDPPPTAFRLHIADDDFACDKARAVAFFRELPRSRFRLSSAQVAISDLCRREGGQLLPEPDLELLSAITPACFADAARRFPRSDFVADHRSRRWSSYLQIGVETFSDAELARLGKGYRRVHVRAIAAALAQRGLHFDAYLILSNADTSGDDLIDVLHEVARHKLRFPVHFHARFPVVPRLVSYFTAASHRRMLRQGKADRFAVRRHLRAPEAPELDYPLVDHDLPADPWVEAAVAPGAVDPAMGIFTDEARYIGAAERLRALWVERLAALPPERRGDGERLVRRLDDSRRRLVFELLRDAREGGGGGDWPAFRPAPDEALAAAEELLGPRAGWLPAFARFCHESVPRLVIIPTWQCELRCSYCFIPKQDGRVMDLPTARRALGLLLSSDQPRLTLQFFGGEALLEWGLVRAVIEEGHARAQALGKELTFILSSNGWSLDAEKLAWLAQHPVKLELSLDGAPDLQNRFRASRDRAGDSYTAGIAPRAREIVESGLPYDVIMVVHPKGAGRVDESFAHIASLGFRRIQINFALGFRWTGADQQALADGLHRLGRWLLDQGDAAPIFINAEQPPMPIRLNGELTVDWDGALYGGNGFLHETDHKQRFRVGHLDDLGGFDRYWLDAPDNRFLLAWSYPEDVTENNLKVGALMTRFVRWLRAQRGLDGPGAAVRPDADGGGGDGPRPR